MVLTGRRRINYPLSADDALTEQSLRGLLEFAFNIHSANKMEIDYLMSYYKGIQPILYKEKDIRFEINNKPVVNHAYRITRTILGYFMGSPVQYIQASDVKYADIDLLNSIMSDSDKGNVDSEIALFQSVTGLGYKIVYSDNLEDGEVLSQKALDPSTTFVVYENSIAERPIAGVTYHINYNEDGDEDGFKVYVYARNGLYVGVSNSEASFINTSFSFTPYMVGGIPIVEYPNNRFRIGDWEFALSLMDTINALQGDRLDDIQQIVQSLLVFINADIDEAVYNEMREKGIIMLKNTTQNTADIKVINAPLDQSGLNAFSIELEGLLNSIVGVPSRGSSTGASAETGQGVELQDGWMDLELVARNKESVFRRSETKALRVILNMLKSKSILDLSIKDVDIKFTRNKNNNLLVKTQSYQTLLSTQTLDPTDALTIVDLVSDEGEFISRGKSYWDANKPVVTPKPVDTSISLE